MLLMLLLLLLHQELPLQVAFKSNS